MSRIPTLIALALMVGAPSSIRAQTTIVDEGAFRILISGRDVGRETFSIRQSGTGSDAAVVATGRISLGAQRIVSSLELQGAGLRPAAYQVEVQGEGTTRIAGRVAGGRFSARIISPGGEQMREYLVSDGAIVIDDGVAHQYYFVGRQLDGSVSFPLVIPQRNRQLAAAATVSGTETIEVGSGSTTARRVVIQPTGGEERIVWIDPQGRVLRVEVPSRNYVAVRTELP